MPASVSVQWRAQEWNTDSLHQLEMPSLICFNLKCCAVFLHAGHALTHLHWIKRCSEHNNSNITDNNGNDNAHSQRRHQQQQEQEELVQHQSSSRSMSSPCCCIVKWKSTDIVAEKFPFVHSGKAEAGKWSELLLWSERKTATGSRRQEAAHNNGNNALETSLLSYYIHYTSNLLCICMRRITESRYANWTATTEAI